jgi:hypothetical protein
MLQTPPSCPLHRREFSGAGELPPSVARFAESASWGWVGAGEAVGDGVGGDAEAVLRHQTRQTPSPSNPHGNATKPAPWNGPRNRPILPDLASSGGLWLNGVGGRVLYSVESGSGDVTTRTSYIERPIWLTTKWRGSML